MAYENQEELDNLACELIRQRKIKRRSKKSIEKFAKFQNYCIERFKYLVVSKLYRYRQFSNYQDLEQDGYEALLLALRTYNPDKGSFTWWADKYISTRISRAANTHSTIRFPLKKAKELKPFKTTVIPIIVDGRPNASESFDRTETSDVIRNAVKQLPEEHQQVVSLIYGLHGKQHSIVSTIKVLSISRPHCIKILEEARARLKESLSSSLTE